MLGERLQINAEMPPVLAAVATPKIVENAGECTKTTNLIDTDLKAKQDLRLKWKNEEILKQIE